MAHIFHFHHFCAANQRKSAVGNHAAPSMSYYLSFLSVPLVAANVHVSECAARLAVKRIDVVCIGEYLQIASSANTFPSLLPVPLHLRKCDGWYGYFGDYRHFCAWLSCQVEITYYHFAFVLLLSASLSVTTFFMSARSVTRSPRETRFLIIDYVSRVTRSAHRLRIVRHYRSQIEICAFWSVKPFSRPLRVRFEFSP